MFMPISGPAYFEQLGYTLFARQEMQKNPSAFFQN